MNRVPLSQEHMLCLEPAEPDMAPSFVAVREIPNVLQYFSGGEFAIEHDGRVLAICGVAEWMTEDEAWVVVNKDVRGFEAAALVRFLKTELSRLSKPVVCWVQDSWAAGEYLAQALGFAPDDGAELRQVTMFTRLQRLWIHSNGSTE